MAKRVSSIALSVADEPAPAMPARDSAARADTADADDDTPDTDDENPVAVTEPAFVPDDAILARDADARAAADYERRGPADRRLIDAFVDRSLRENAALAAEAREVGMRIVDAANERAVTDLFDELVTGASA